MRKSANAVPRKTKSGGLPRAERATGPGFPLLLRFRSERYQQGPGEIENVTCLRNFAHCPPNVIFPVNKVSLPLPLP